MMPHSVSRWLGWLLVTAFVIGAALADDPRKGKGGGWVILPSACHRERYEHHATLLYGSVHLELDRATMDGAYAVLRVSGWAPILVQPNHNVLTIDQQMFDGMQIAGENELEIRFVAPNYMRQDVRLVIDAKNGTIEILVR